MQSLPCFLCGRKLEKRVSKSDKPYFVCDSCGIQLFVRRKDGIERLGALLRAAERNSIPFREHAQRLSEIQAILNDIRGTKVEIKKLENETGIIFPDQDKIRACNSLKTRLETLQVELEELVKTKTR
jgi:hypothetical protein